MCAEIFAVQAIMADTKGGRVWIGMLAKDSLICSLSWAFHGAPFLLCWAELLDTSGSFSGVVKTGLSGAEADKTGLSGAEVVKNGLSGAEAVRTGLSGVEAVKKWLSGVEVVKTGLTGVEAGCFRENSWYALIITWLIKSGCRWKRFKSL